MTKQSSQQAAFHRRPWDDRFTPPSAERLRDELGETARAFFDELRDHLRAQDGVEESCAWYGSSWRWSVDYRRADESQPIALLIPNPADFQVAIPIGPDLVEQLQGRSFKRTVRDGLELAFPPFDTRWGVWSIQHPGLVRDLRRVIDMKLANAAP